MNNTNKKPSQHDVIKLLSQNQVNKLPNFGAGDLVTVHQRIFDGKKSRIQKFQGIVLKRSGSGLSENILVRKESSGIGVEKFFPIHSPLVETIEVNRYGKVRRAFISYMRQRSGKAARIKEGKRKKA